MRRECFTKEHAFCMSVLLDPGLGGYLPAVLDNNVERDFIREAQKGWSDLRSYFIGDSAVYYPAFSATDSGNIKSIYCGYHFVNFI